MKLIKMKNSVIIVLFVAALVGDAFAKTENITKPEGLQLIESRLLDKAWRSPVFEPKKYNSIIINWEEHDYRQGQKRFTHRNIKENYEFTGKTKTQLEKLAKGSFEKQFNLLQNYRVVDLDAADSQTMTINLRLVDIVKMVPDIHQMRDLKQLYMRQFGAATLEIEILKSDNQQLLFKGYVREDIESIGNELERVNAVSFRHQTKRLFDNWAQKLRKYIDNM